MNSLSRSVRLLRRLVPHRLLAAIGLLSVSATVQAHNLDTRVTTFFFEKDFIATMSARATLGQSLIQVNDLLRQHLCQFRCYSSEQFGSHRQHAGWHGNPFLRPAAHCGACRSPNHLYHPF